MYGQEFIIVNRQLVTENIRWKTPDIGWVRLNTDGASRRNNVAGCGGVLRDHNGKWICGFSKWLGVCSAYVAELWGVLEGLKMARERGFHKVELHVDSKAVVSNLVDGKGGSAMGLSLLTNIRSLLELNWEVRICHTFREANSCADALANLACDGGSSLIIYEQCPVQMRLCFLADYVGVATPRLIKR